MMTVMMQMVMVMKVMLLMMGYAIAANPLSGALASCGQSW